MFVIPHDDGHAVVLQTDHAAQCAGFVDVWGNESFDPIEPLTEVRLAAEHHDIGWIESDATPRLDLSTGLPFDFRDLDFAEHLDIQLKGARRLAEIDPYAGLLASMHFASRYERPRAIGLLRSQGRRLRSYLARNDALQAELRAKLRISDEEVDRNWRLMRTCDGLSNDMLQDRVPVTRPGIPARAGTTAELRLSRRGDVHVLDPWPFVVDRVLAPVGGRLLKGTFAEAGPMRAALAEAPRVTLNYVLAVA